MENADPELLAHPRPLVTSELHASNDFYGHARLLKRYAGVPRYRSLKAVIEHGINFQDHEWSIDLASGLPVFLVAGEERARRVSSTAACSAVAIGPLVLYAPPGRAPSRRRVLVAFPAHSTHHVDAEYDVDNFATAVLEAAAGFDETLVCLYWRDVQRGLMETYARRGLRCVTAGHIFDPNFLIRLRCIIEEGTAVITNEVGSHLVYAVALGRPVWVTDQDIRYAADAEVLVRDGADSESWPHQQFRELRDLFADRRDELSAEQQDVVSEIGGFSSVRSPAQLASILRHADEEYRRRVPLHRRNLERTRRLFGPGLARVRFAGDI